MSRRVTYAGQEYTWADLEEAEDQTLAKGCDCSKGGKRYVFAKWVENKALGQIRSLAPYGPALGPTELEQPLELGYNNKETKLWAL